jgi:hypothetical protein
MLLTGYYAIAYYLPNANSSNFATCSCSRLLSELLKLSTFDIRRTIQSLQEFCPLLHLADSKTVHPQPLPEPTSILSPHSHTLGNGCNNIDNIFFNTSFRIASTDKNAAYLPLAKLPRCIHSHTGKKFHHVA